MAEQDLGELVLNYDPLHPQPEFFRTATEAQLARSRAGLPEPVPWPAGGEPAADGPTHPPSAADPLPPCQVLVVTWTVAEARTLASLFTPGAQLEDWFEYTHKVNAFLRKVTGKRAPFNTRGKNDSNRRYYHSLGLYYPCRIGEAKVLCFKSGLHLDYDGPAAAVRDLWNQILDETGCQVVVTTGTGGGIGAGVKLGDVVIGRQTVFHCTRQFKSEPFAKAAYDTSPVDGKAFRALTAALLKPNADRLPDGTGLPRMLYVDVADGTPPNVVTTDYFAYDDTKNTNGLQGLGCVCDMGDAALGLALSTRPSPPKWFAIRNASDPQMDGSLPKADRDNQAGQIYKRYGTFTTAGSVLATWAVIRNLYPGAGPRPARPAAKARAAAAARPAPQPPDPSDLLMTLVSGGDLAAHAVKESAVPRDTVARLKAELKEANVSYASSDRSFREVTFTDELGTPRRLHVAHVSNDDAESFRGSYLFEGGELITKQEFVSG